MNIQMMKIRETPRRKIGSSGFETENLDATRDEESATDVEETPTETAAAAESKAMKTIGTEIFDPNATVSVSKFALDFVQKLKSNVNIYICSCPMLSFI